MKRKTLRITALLVGLPLCMSVAKADLSPGAAEVVKLTKAGMGPDVVISYAKGASGKFQLSVDNIIALKDQGVPPQVITAMITHDNDQAVARSAPITAAPAQASAKAPEAAPSYVPQAPAPAYMPSAPAPAPTVIYAPPATTYVSPPVEVVTVSPGPEYYWVPGYWNGGIWIGGAWTWGGGGFRFGGPYRYGWGGYHGGWGHAGWSHEGHGSFGGHGHR